MKLNFIIGFFMVPLFLCSTIFADEHSETALKLTRLPSCSVILNLQYENIERLKQITKDTMDILVQENPAFRYQANRLAIELRFRLSPYSGYNLIGGGQLNDQKTIQSTGEVLKQFGHALNKMIKKWMLVASNVESGESKVLLTSKFRQIIDSTLIQMLGADYGRQVTPAFYSFAACVLRVFHFGPNFQDIGQLNWRETFQDSSQKLKSFTDGLMGIGNKWEAVLAGQQQGCDYY